MLAGHLDTVPVHGNLPSRLDGGLLYGCGSCDMKSGVAVQLRLAAQLTAAARDVTYVFYDCEEVEAERNGLLRLSRTSPELLAGDFAVLHGADRRRVGRGRLPGHAAGRRHRHAASGRTARDRGSGRTPSTRQVASSTCCAAISRGSRRSTGWPTTKG